MKKLRYIQMNKTVLAAIIYCLLMAFSPSVYAGVDVVTDTYTGAAQKLAKHCSMDYTSTCTYPDGNVRNINGRMVIDDQRYYDSSNERFVFVNNKWLIYADHVNREIRTLYLPSFQQTFGNSMTMMFSDFLVNNNSLLKYTTATVEEMKDDTYWIHLHYDQSAAVIKEINLQFKKGTANLLQYTGTVSISDNGTYKNTVKPGSILLQFRCFNLSADVPEALFNDDRLIQSDGKKATLKRFRDYKMRVSRS